MKIGLVRHFKVAQPLPKGFLIDFDTLSNWFDKYDEADVVTATVDMRNIAWQKCYASSMSRATKTARHIYEGPIQTHDDLREINVLGLMNKARKLPIMVWALIIKRKTFTRNAVSVEARDKLNAFVDTLLQQQEQEILVVSHGFVMMFLQKALTARGFSGETFGNPVNGKVYVFEK